MKEFIEDLKYMCSSSNTTSRGFYIGITVILVLMLLGMVASLVLLIVNAVKGFFNPLFAILFVVALIIFVGVIIWMKKS